MTYITRIANKRILAKYFLYSLQINYLHWKLSASRSIFSCYATFLFVYIIPCTHLHIFVLLPLPLLPYLATWPTSTHTSLSLAIKICHIFGLTLASQSLPSPILALLKGYNGASCSKHVQFKNFLELKFSINSLKFPYHFLSILFWYRKLSLHYCHTFGL